MEIIQDQTLSGTVVLVDGKFFIGCKFTGCRLLYCGGDFGWQNTQFQDCNMQFEGTAAKVVKFLQYFELLPGGPIQHPPTSTLSKNTVN